MAEEVEFGQDVSSKKANTQVGLNLYPPKENQSITVRFVGKQHKLFQRWDKQTRSYSFSQSKQDGYSVRIISFVIDRVEDRIKAFICPASVFKIMGNYNKNHDFRVTRRGGGLNTRYEVDSLGETEVSDDIIEKIQVTSEVHSLSDIFTKGEKWRVLDKEHEPILDRFDILDL